MRKSIAVAAMGAALIVSPTAAHAKLKPVEKLTEKPVITETQIRSALDGTKLDPTPKHEELYIDVRQRFEKEFSPSEAGRDIVRDGFKKSGGAVVRPSPEQVRQSTDRMKTALNPPEPAPVATGTESVPAESASYDTAGAPTEVIECESGGDYGANTGNGYYGAYQFDQSTWDAYAPEGYAGTLPSEAPAEVQDATAAAVPYDAWPNC